MANNNNNRSSHLLSYTLASGMIGIALYFWKNRNDHAGRKDREATALFTNSDWERMLTRLYSRNNISTTSSTTNSGADDNARECIYLDYNGTTPVYPGVLYAMLPYFTNHYGNPSSGHIIGREPRRAVDEARRTILKSIFGADDAVDISSIWFTACGTESDNLAIILAIQATSAKFAKSDKIPHIVTCNVEHPAIAVCLEALEKEGRIRVTYVPVDTEGYVQANNVIQALTSDTILVTLMLANNESGALQPVQQVAKACRERGILMHTDAAQAVGKVSVQLQDLGDPDMITIVGHKIGAPKGIAALYVRPNCLSEQGREIPHNHGILLLGGGQEFGRRGGTENVPYIVGLAKAAEMAAANLVQNAKHMEDMRGRLLQKLKVLLSDNAGIQVRPNGPSDPLLRLPNTLSVGLENIHSGDLLAELSELVAASAGAACHSAAGVSSVLTAMKVPEAFALGTVRLSVGPNTTVEEIDQAAELIAKTAIEQSQSDFI